MKKIALIVSIILALGIVYISNANNHYPIVNGTFVGTEEEYNEHIRTHPDNLLEEDLEEMLMGGTPTPTSSANRKYVEASDFYLYSPGVSADTSITLNNLKDIYGNALDMDDFGSLGYGRIDPDGASVSESFTFTGITANTDGTYTLTGIKTVLAKYPYTQTSGLIRSHSINAIVRFTNSAAFYDSFANKENKEIIELEWTFNSFPKITTSTALPDADGEFATKYYADTVGAGGFTSANVSTTLGLEALGTSPETVGINASTSLGYTFDEDGELYRQLVSNGMIKAGSDGLYFDLTSSSIFTGNNTTTGHTAFATGTFSGTLDVSGTSTLATTTIADLTINGTSTDALVEGGNADALHTHRYSETFYSTSTSHTFTNSKVRLELFTTTLSGGELGTDGVIHITIPISDYDSEAASRAFYTVLRVGDSYVTSTITGAFEDNSMGQIDIYLMANASTISQTWLTRGFMNIGGFDAAVAGLSNWVTTGGLAFDSTVDTTIGVYFAWNNDSAENSVTIPIVIADITK